MATTRALAIVMLLVLTGCGAGARDTPSAARLIPITTVEVLTAETFPVQMSIHVRGSQPGAGCWSAPVTEGPVRAGYSIAITVTAALSGAPPSAACEAWSYDRTFPLGSDLATGDYRVRVNDVEQSFHFEAGYGP